MSRHDRAKEAIKKEVSNILLEELEDPRLGFVTITDVELSQNMRHAKVFFSVLGKEEDYKKTKDALDSALGFIRRLVAERVNLRLAPEIIFREDRSSEYSMKIQQVLEEIKVLEGSNDKETRKEGRVESRPSSDGMVGKTVKEGRDEPKKSRKPHKKK